MVFYRAVPTCISILTKGLICTFALYTWIVEVSAQEVVSQGFEIAPEVEGVKIVNHLALPNPNYLLLDVIIDPKTKPTTVTFISTNGEVRFDFDLKSRHSKPRGLDGSDIIYLVTPDRFANGDTTNDAIQGFHQDHIDRDDPYARHGGDLHGLIDNIDHIFDLGATALWPNPLLENDQPLESYHGYAITDHYRIDPRFGTNLLFAELTDTLHARGMKMVMDVIYNHIGDKHPFYTDIPDSSWFHFWERYTKTNYRATTLLDPYASDYDKKIMTDGWFDRHMPDLDQTNPRLAVYLIQQTLWWVEEFGIDALRIDTYAYPDQGFMHRWAFRIKEAFPDLFLFGETWVHGPTVQGWFLGDALGPEPNGLDGLTDFQVHYAIEEALTHKQGWTEGISRLYYTLAADYIYPHPERLVTFVDNHDVARFYGEIKEDFRKFRIGMGLLFTIRGIPSIYYGTEILMSETEGHGLIRQDFPGGWPGDSVDKFTAEGRNVEENRAYDLIARLTEMRRNNPALHSGKTTQFVPLDGLYVFFRYTDQQKIMVAVNTSEDPQKSPISKFQEMLKGQSRVRNLLTDQYETLGDTLEVAPWDIGIWEVMEH